MIRKGTGRQIDRWTEGSEKLKERKYEGKESKGIERRNVGTLYCI